MKRRKVESASRNCFGNVMTMIGIFVLMFAIVGLSQRIPLNTNQYILLITAVRNYYSTSCVLFVQPGNYEDLYVNTAVHTWSRAFSDQGVLSVSINFEDILRDKNRFKKMLVRPLYVVFLSTQDSVDEFANFTKKADVSFPVWFVIFREESEEKLLEQFCMQPTGNVFNLNFKTEMLVLCYDHPELYEWYSMRDNITRTFHFATWKPEEGLVMTTNLSLYARRGNMFGKVLRIASVQESSFTTVNNGKLSGVFGDVMTELSKVMNFTMDILDSVEVYGSFSEEDQVWSGVIAQLAYGEADIGVSEFSMTNRRLNVVDFTLPLILSRNRFYFKKPDASMVQWSGYFKAFNLWVWATIILLIIIAPVVITLLKTKGSIVTRIVTENYIHVWGIYCQQGLSVFPSDSSLRLAFFSIFVSALIVSSAYSASLISFLTVNTASLPFSDLKGLANDQSYKMVVFRNSADYDMFRTAKDRVLKNLMKLMKNKHELPLTMTAGFAQVCSEKVTFYTTEAIKKALEIYLPCKIVFLESGGYDSLAFVLTKGNPYTNLINYHLQRFKDTGVLNRLKAKYLVRGNPPESTHVPVTVHGIIPILSIVGGGICMALFVLTLEKMYYNTHRNKRNNLDDRLVTKVNNYFGVKHGTKSKKNSVYSKFDEGYKLPSTKRTTSYFP